MAIQLSRGLSRENRAYLIPCKAQYERTIADALWPFWRERYDEQYGSFLVSMDLQGNHLNTDKPAWSVPRSLAILALLHEYYSGNREYASQAKDIERRTNQTLDFILDRGITPAGGDRCYHGVMQDGRPVDDEKESLFTNLFAVYALALYAQRGITQRRDEAIKVASRILERTIGIHESGNEAGMWSPTTIPPGYRLHASDMLLTLASHHLAKATGDKGEVNLAQEYASMVLNNYLTNVEGRLVLLERLKVVDDHKGKKYVPDLDTPTGRLVIPGHGLESFWFVMDHLASSDVSDEAVWQRATKGVRNTFELGWDWENPKMQGLMLNVDAISGKRHPEDKGLMPWWDEPEAALACLRSFEKTGDPVFLHYHRLAHQAYFGHHFVPSMGEAIQRLNKDGEPDPTPVAFNTLDPMHTMRNFIYMIGVINRILNINRT